MFETECFSNLFLEVSQIQLEQLEFKLEKNEIQKPTGKVRILFIFYFLFVLTFVDYHDHFFLAKQMGFDHPVTQVRIHKYPCHRRQNIQR